MNDEGWPGYIILVAMFIVAALAVAISFGPARGHSFYDAYCCNGTDCAPISETRVRVVVGGYLLDGKYFIAEKDARNSQDGDYHACFWPTPDTLRCFYRPPMGF